MPTVALVKAGASLVPSPTMRDAPHPPSRGHARARPCPRAGGHPALRRYPTARATPSAFAWASPRAAACGGPETAQLREEAGQSRGGSRRHTRQSRASSRPPLRRRGARAVRVHCGKVALGQWDDRWTMSAQPPTATTRPSTSPVMPCPGVSTTWCASAIGIPRAAAAHLPACAPTGGSTRAQRSAPQTRLRLGERRDRITLAT
jgi:hypothetical protein